METYAFWNNKGGTGKTSLAFQAITLFASMHSQKKILTLDMCPQANLSELLLGGLVGNGSSNLLSLYKSQETKRRSVGGYFDARLPSPYQQINFEKVDFICSPSEYNKEIPVNIDLLAGDPLVELQSNAIAALSNTQIPGRDPWLDVTDWIRDFIENVQGEYDIVFIDTNPSFSIYTQIALSAAAKLIVPVMADDSSRRALQNVLSLVHGHDLPSKVYSDYSFTTKLEKAKRDLPKIHLIVWNRITQYMGAASAYREVFKTVDEVLEKAIARDPDISSFHSIEDGKVKIRDFQTTGVVAFAKGLPFDRLRAGKHLIKEREIQLQQTNIDNCTNAIQTLVKKL